MLTLSALTETVVTLVSVNRLLLATVRGNALDPRPPRAQLKPTSGRHRIYSP